jgi:hypothetical protein
VRTASTEGFDASQDSPVDAADQSTRAPSSLSPTSDCIVDSILHTESSSRSDHSPENCLDKTSTECDCLLSGLSALEAFEIENFENGNRKIDRNLAFQKSMLVHCSRLLDCRWCLESSSFVMLLVILLQKTTISLERIVQEVKDLQGSSRLDSTKASPPNKSREISRFDLQHSSRPKLFMCNYKIDEQDESYVFIGLVARQLKLLLPLLVRLKQIASKSSLETHCSIIDALEKRAQIQQKICDDFQ